MKEIKLTFWVLLAVVLFASCEKIEGGSEPNEQRPVINDEYLLTTPYEVVVKEGFVTEVMMGDERLAFTDIPMTIDIPKTATRSADGALVVRNIPYANLPEFAKGTGVSEKTHVLMFEDSRKGDYDYNDFVVLVKHSVELRQTGRTSFDYGHDFVIKPLAYGATKSIKFGYMDDNSGKVIYFSKNTRADYFGGSGSMVNTAKGGQFKSPINDNLNEHVYLEFDGPYFERIMIESFNKTQQGKELVGGYYKYATHMQPTADVSKLNKNVNYFIEVDNGVKLYIAEAGTGSGAKLPYGLAIPSSIKTYPVESQAISNLFPGFQGWVTNPNSNVDWYKSDAGTGFNIDIPALFRWYPAYFVD